MNLFPSLTADYIQEKYIDYASIKLEDHYVISFEDFKDILEEFARIIQMSHSPKQNEDDENVKNAV